MSDQRIFAAPDVNLGELTGVLTDWFSSKGFEAQTVEAPGGGFAIQARKPEAWRNWVGLSSALNVTLNPQGDNILVQTGAAKWLDKAGAAAGGLILGLWPVLIPAAYGAWKQSQLPNEVFQVIEQFLTTGQAPVGVGAPAGATARAPIAATTPCPSCGKSVRADAKFCDSCGASLLVTCASCDAVLRTGAKFCDSCGAKVSP